MSLVQSELNKLQDILNRLGNGTQQTQLVNSAGTEIGTTAVPIQVDIADATGITITADTEFPAAAAITDNFANPTTTSVMSMLMGYDGATWDRLLIGAGGAGGGAAALRVVLATDTALPAGSNLIGLVQPFAAVIELGLTELVGINEVVAQNQYSASVNIPFGATFSGELLNVTLYMTEDGTGAILTPAGTLLILDADPATAAGDTAITAAERVTVMHHVSVAAADWQSDANGASVELTVAKGFHALTGLTFLWFHEDATSINSAAGDDEQMEMNAWIRRDS